MNPNAARNTKTRLCGTIAVLGVMGGCSGDSSTPAGDPDDGLPRGEVAESVARTVILETLEAAVAKTDELEQATADYAESLAPEDLETAQAAWRSAMNVWQQAEVFQVGPAGPSSSVIGGQDLRDLIYSWPLINPCRVDMAVVSGVYEDPDDLVQEVVNVRGFDALEYLLFNDSLENACASTNSINADEDGWAELSEADLNQRRADFAHVAAELLAEDVLTLFEAWSPDHGDFLSEISNAGEEDSLYRSGHQALNALTDALFYVEKETKDMKLGKPIGVFECTTATCPEALESVFAHRSKQHIRQNVLAFQLAYAGGDPEADGLGLDDLLLELGEDELNDELEDGIQASLDSLGDIEEADLAEALEEDLTSVEEAHAALSEVMALFEDEFLSILQLELPDRAAGDAD